MTGVRRAAAVAAVIILLPVLAGCVAGRGVDLGPGSGNLIAAIGGEPDQLDPQRTSAYFSFEVLENVFDTLVAPDAEMCIRDRSSSDSESGYWRLASACS